MYLPFIINLSGYLILMTLLIKLFVKALIVLLCQQSKLNIVMIAISALNDLVVKVIV